MNTPIARDSGALLGKLRNATQPAHHALEGVLGLLASDLGIGAYEDILCRLFGFWTMWEPHMVATLDDARMFEPRRRLHLIEADLGALGYSSRMLSTLPICPLLTLRGRAEAIGSLYVLEGSTLGGKVIQRHLSACFGSQIARGYFTGYGVETGPMWRKLLKILETLPAEQAEQAVSGAIMTFEHLGWWLSRTDRPELMRLRE